MSDLTKADIKIRVIKKEDYDPIVGIDTKITGVRRLVFYKRKITVALDKTQHPVSSLVAEVEGKVVGFIMGDVFIGEYGIPDPTASIDTLGVDPDYRRQGIARVLTEEFIKKVKKAGVERIYTQLHWNDWTSLKFFETMGFVPAKMVNLELKI